MSTRWVLSGLVLLGSCDEGTQDVFDTDGAVDGEPLGQARFLLEHNATDHDIGFQVFVDGEPWDRLRVGGDGGQVIDVEARGNLVGFGLTEGFFESNEPTDAEVPLQDVLDLYPEGTYDFVAVSSDDGSLMRGAATLTHDVPSAPVILTPAEDAVVGLGEAVVSWAPVTTSITGGPIAIVGYQVIVAKEEEDEAPTPSFFHHELSLFVAPGVTSVRVPSEFLEAGAPYQIEVLAIETSGNQTIGLRAFETAAPD